MGFRTSVSTVAILFVFILSNAPSPCDGQLSSSFYDRTCPNALTTIRTTIRRAVSRERRMAASLVRLQFHDCFVQGCDASVLLDQTSTIQTEKTTIHNNNSLRGFEVIEEAKREVEKICPGVVSCADIVALASRDSSVAVGGPSWTVKLGRRDSTTTNPSAAVNDLPGPFDTFEQLISLFRRKGFNARELVALSGSHTIGLARCITFRSRIYNDSADIDAGFARTRRRRCPGPGDNNSTLAPLDLVTPNSFDNNYFKNILRRKGLLQSDQNLYGGRSTDKIVEEYGRNPRVFSSDFASAMVKMGDLEPLTGDNGIIRRICNVVN